MMTDIVSADAVVRPPTAVVRRAPPAAHRRAWSEDEDMTLRRLLAEEQLIGPVAQALGRTREGVRNRANLLGLSVRSSPGQGRRRLD
jgi:hypothetical protein